jgi:hypothetical protein
VSDIINTGFKLRILTGIHNLALLNVLVCLCTLLEAMKFKSKLNTKKLVLLSLMHLTLDTPITALNTI